MAVTIDIMTAGISHYVLTGDTRHLDGTEGKEFETPTEETPPLNNQVERWRQRVDAADHPFSMTSDAASPRSHGRGRSTGQHSPSPSNSYPVNSRLEVSIPRDISAWVVSIPAGAIPPDDAPWSSPIDSDSSTSEALEEHLIAHTDRKPGPDISTVALSSEAHPVIPRASIDVHQWRYENYVDWWRTGMNGEQQGHRKVSRTRNGVASKPSTPSDSGEFAAKEEIGQVEKPAQRSPPKLSIPPPPPTPPVAYITTPAPRSASHPSLHNGVQVSSPESLKRVYYRLINLNEEPLPVRKAHGTINDKSIGILFLENPSVYRAGDLMNIIHTRECSHINSPMSPRYSPTVRRKFAETEKMTSQRPSKKRRAPKSPSASACSGSFAIQQDLPRLQIDMKLFFDPQVVSRKRSPSRSRSLSRTRVNLSNVSLSTTKLRRLKTHDTLPSGVGVDEESALIVKVLAHEIPQKTFTHTRTAHNTERDGRPVIRTVQKCGTFLAVVVRGVAVGVKTVGDGLAKLADSLSGTSKPRCDSD